MGMENAILKWKTERTMIENTRYTLTALIGFGMKRNPHSLGNHMRGRKLLWTTGPWNALPDRA